MGAVRFSFDRPGVLAAVTGREGGVSEGELASLNLSFEVGDDPARVIANRKIAGDSLGFDFRDLVIPRQVHGVRVKVVGEQDRGRGADSSGSGVAACDALITSTPMLPMAVLVADCAPVVLYDPAQPAIGIVHAGWRGAIGRIAQKAVEAMERELHCRPRDIRAGIGPGLQPLSLEVSMNEAVQAEGEFHQQPAVLYDAGDKPHLDLPYMLKQQLLDAGVWLKNIEDSRMDTLDAQRFFSHRGQSGQAGRCMAIAMLQTA
ncbi:MAG: polyphenol oxidase family protein [bacterium]|nr:polyphenol oxidase family protein [bacterium]MCY4272641.1 polyphenol oxidase family protein [bacterium]